MNPDVAVVNATILADLPQRLYRLKTEGGSQLVAGLSPQVQRLGTTFKPGDRVRVRPAASDLGRGTILGLVVDPPQSSPPSPVSGEGTGHST
jgi:translation initiation factor IF-1